MTELKQKFQKHIKNLPDVEGHLFGSIFFNKYTDDQIIRYGSFYTSKEAMNFLLLIEVYPKPKDLSQYKSKQEDDTTIYYGYEPKFGVVPNWDGAVTASRKNKIFTLLNISNKQSSEELLKLVLSAEPVEFSEELQLLYELNKYLPDLVDGWELVTMFFWNTSIESEDSLCWMRHIQGNYTKNGDYLNIEIRYGCKHAVSLKKLPPEGFVVSDEKTLDNPAISYGKVGSLTFLYAENTEKMYSVAVHDNARNKGKHEDSLLKLMESVLTKLNTHSMN